MNKNPNVPCYDENAVFLFNVGANVSYYFSADVASSLWPGPMIIIARLDNDGIETDCFIFSWIEYYPEIYEEFLRDENNKLAIEMCQKYLVLV